MKYHHKMIFCNIKTNQLGVTMGYSPGGGGGGGTPYDDQCTMLGGFGSIFELGSIP